MSTARGLIYDTKRQALYALAYAQNPDYSQNMRLYFFISRDNGETWSDPIDIRSRNDGNCGISSMALDEKTGNLVFGWRDGRNDPNFKTMEYFGAILPAKKLDKLVNSIPLSNPLFIQPPVDMQAPISSLLAKESVHKVLQTRKNRTSGMCKGD